MLLTLFACVFLMDRPPLCPETCAGHLKCDQTGVCKLSCYDDSDCESGYWCDWLDGEQCRPNCKDEDCPGGYVCAGDTGCSNYCFENFECKEGYRCNDYLECVQ